MHFTEQEISVMKDVDFLLTKATVLEKVKTIFTETQVLLHNKTETGFSLPFNFQSGKISRGENYRQLPYLVLDYPAYFSRQNIFTFRTFFWWGHFFSSTLHLQGTYLDILRPKILNNFDQLLSQDIYIGVGETPWEYHYDSDNYRLLSPEHLTYLKQCKFIKLSKKFPLEEWQILPQKVVAYFTLLQEVLGS